MLSNKITAMKNMKQFSLLLFALVLTVFAVSCNNDDDVKEIIPGTPTGTDIRYRLTVSSPIVTLIKYKKGDLNTGTEVMTVDSPMTWTKTIIAKKPFTTKLEVTFRNTTPEVQNYTVEIFTDGVLANTQTGEIPVPPTPPTGQPLATTTISKTFDVE